MTGSRTPSPTCQGLVTVFIPLMAMLAACQRDAAVPQEGLRIAAASDLKFVMDELLPIFQRSHPEAKVAVMIDASGTLHRQILDGTRFDLFLAGDELYPQQLVDRNLAPAAGLFRFARGGLVFWLAASTGLDPGTGLAVLLDPKVKRIAMARPNLAPYGKIAQLALRQANIEPQVEKKLLLADNLLRAAEAAQVGSADAALLTESLVRHSSLKDRGKWQRLPAEAHPPLIQAGIVLPSSNPLAEAFRDLLIGTQGQAVLARHGYLPLRETKP